MHIIELQQFFIDNWEVELYHILSPRAYCSYMISISYVENLCRITIRLKAGAYYIDFQMNMKVQFDLVEQASFIMILLKVYLQLAT